MEKKKVLFVCIHNSARSQMAETFLNDFGADRFIAESAGIEAGKMNPVVIEVMKEIGYDLSKNETTPVSDVLNNGYDIVVTVCDESAAERCPLFPGKVERLHWGFRDPSSFDGTAEEKLAFTREVRDEIKEKVASFVKEQENE